MGFIDALAKVSGWRRLERQRRHGCLSKAMKAADSLRDAGDYSAAATAYEAIVFANPRSFGAWGQLGNMRKDLGAFEKAELAYRHALDIRSDDADIRVQMGHLKKLQSDFLGARAWYEAALERSPDNAELIGELAWLAERDRSISSYSDLGLASETELDICPEAVVLHTRLTKAFERRRA